VRGGSIDEGRGSWGPLGRLVKLKVRRVNKEGRWGDDAGGRRMMLNDGG